MLFHLTLSYEAFHKPTQRWHTHSSPFGVRAVSRKHAITKGLKEVTRWPGYADRVEHEDWEAVGAEARIND